MRIAVTGPIATDHLVTFPWRFIGQFIPDKVGRVSRAGPVPATAPPEGPEAAALVDGAAYPFCNECEKALIERKTGSSGAGVLRRAGVRVTMLGPAGARALRTTSPAISADARPPACGRALSGSGRAPAGARPAVP